MSMFWHVRARSRGRASRRNTAKVGAYMRESASGRIAAIGVALAVLAGATLVTAALARADGGHGKPANSADDGGVAAGAGVNANANADAGATNNTNANGGVGHTPMTICHWVP